VMAATQKINDIVEGWIREHPEQWLWLHDRWRMTIRR
jgi:Kdo2-lipid IVA lauroyltransferase/acyltransferase